ncbi:MAG TPA: FmdB family zinc ribbon protein [Thermoanaerobaculia bacterium]|nr:FmdB family zinc ribbon protein [Thermoanaerobaculia bacterium]
MPLHEYVCTVCGLKIEALQSFSEPPLTVCESCGGELKKLLSAPAVQFKGSGWYVSDYGRSKSGESKSGESKSDASAPGAEKAGSTEKAAEKSDKADKAEKSEKSEKSEKAPKETPKASSGE